MPAGVGILQELVQEDPTVPDFRGVLASCHLSLGLMLLQAGKPAQAEIECRKAQVLSEKLMGENPSVGHYKSTNAMALDNLGDVARSSGRTAEAKSFYDRAIALRAQLLKDDSAFLASRYGIVYSTRRHGLALRDLGDLAGAVADTRRALRVANGLAPWSIGYFFELASCHAALAGLAGRAGSGDSPAEAEAEAARAMECLRRAVASGFRNTNQLRIESALDPLRNRSDFKKLVAELEKNSPSQQQKK